MPSTDQDKTTVDVRHNPGANRFETTVDGLLCHCDYEMRGKVMAMTHTEVPAALGGRGIAGQLVEAAVRYARENGIKIAPYCPFVRGYVKRHPEFDDVLA
jgi:predicted GNAT family acetyltransferase